MADKKISQLPAATTPLAGTEVLPIVQSSTTDQVSVANLTAGRAVSAASLTLTASPLAIASGGTNQTAFTSPASSIAGLVWFDGTSFQNDSTPSHVGYNASTNVFYANTPTFSGDTTLSTGNLVVGTSGKGIDFSATPGTGTSELLADYEEGTWTPSVGGTATYNTTYTKGTYTKVGRLVKVIGELYITTIGSGSTGIITGLPFAANGSNPTDNPGSIGYYANLTPTMTWVTCVATGSSVYLLGNGTAGGTTIAYNASGLLKDSSRVQFSATYFI